MNKIFVPFLPPWVETGLQPAFYDKESGTVLQQVARMYDKVNQLIRNFNELSSETRETVEEYILKFTELKDFVEDYFDNLDLQEEVNNKLDEMAESGELDELINKLPDFSDSNVITVGDNLLTDGSLWVLNSGWTTDGNASFTHIVDQTGDLVYNYNFDANKTYIVDFQVNTSYPAGSDNAGNDFTVTIGNTKPIITYRGGGSMHYTIALRPTTAGTLNFKCVKHNDPYTASGAFDGTISSITLKEATGTLDQLGIKDGNDAVSLAFTIPSASTDNVVIGKNAGVSNYNQTKNVYIGSEAGRDDKTGYFNTGVGATTLRASVNSTRNTAIGFSALANMESGDRNTALGTFAMSGNKYGRKNIAIGFDTMMSLQTGEDNMAIGNQALISVTDTKNQMAIGPMALGGSSYSGTNPNIAIGKVAMYYDTTGDNNIAIGGNAMYKNTTGSNNIAIGMTALSQAQTAENNIAIGNNALGGYAVTGSNNVAIGKTDLYYNTTGGGNVALGNNALYKNTTGNNNIGIGNNALNVAQTVSGLIGIGGNAINKVTDGGYSVVIGSDMNQANLTTASRSTVIGSVNLLNMTGVTNSCILGYNIKASESHPALQNVIAINTGRRAIEITRDNCINICNVIYGDTFTYQEEKIGISESAPYARLHIKGGTANAGTAPLKFSSGTLLSSPENGAFEYDGTHLYFTCGGTRHTIV